MELTNAVKKSIMEGFLQVITRFSEQHYHERIWIRGEGPECDSFDDAFCDFFGEARPILKDFKKFNISNEQYSHLIRFGDALQRFGDQNPDDPQTFIGNPAWDVVTHLAQEVLKAFHYQKNPLLNA